MMTSRNTIGGTTAASRSARIWTRLRNSSAAAQGLALGAELFAPTDDRDQRLRKLRERRHAIRQTLPRTGALSRLAARHPELAVLHSIGCQA